MKTDKLSSMGRQRGASVLTTLVMVLFFGSLLTLVIKLGPVYIDDLTIQEALESLEGTEGLSGMGPAQVLSLINKRLSVNNIRGFDLKQIQIEKDGDIVHLNVDYEVRNNIISNVDAVIHFQHEYELKGK
ncbi:DUF4845 domain-containing protein [Marinobacter lutaoensis]|jgi:hypothetical protein|uniref:DUF4845 domain-containing protein n=1 Tax=Marinobacter lutaoensis TaxID=135739 RepID=A0A1V2DQ92_9GAMM|nr:DUF4845 domain-containing protein [Marinobacter lutaoensis]NVD34620.1 DUF4845 domain-containing protein [Marinobacter lutaoensis]ONF42843.1 DUF4845 domain-containing protein [Marinobacter lutaoensis]